MRRYVKFILLLLVAVFIIWFFGRSLDWQEVGASLRRAQQGYILAAVLVICVGYLLRAKRWQVLLEPFTPTDLRELFATTTVGFSAVFFIGRAGEIVRPMWLPMRDKRVRPSAALVTLGIERIFDLAAIICFFAVNLLLVSAPAGREAEFDYIRKVGYLMLLAVPLGFLGLYIYHKIAEKVTGFVERMLSFRLVPRRLKRIVISLLDQLTLALNSLKDWKEIASITFWTIALWLAIAVPTWFVLLAFNLPLTLADAIFVMGWAALGSLVPTPGGAAGPFHMATAGGMIFLNVARDEAAAASIAMHLVYFAPAVLFGLYYFLRGDISISRIRNLLDSVRSVEDLEREEKSGEAAS